MKTSVASPALLTTLILSSSQISGGLAFNSYLDNISTRPRINGETSASVPPTPAKQVSVGSTSYLDKLNSQQTEITTAPAPTLNTITSAPAQSAVAASTPPPAPSIPTLTFSKPINIERNEYRTTGLAQIGRDTFLVATGAIIVSAVTKSYWPEITASKNTDKMSKFDDKAQDALVSEYKTYFNESKSSSSSLSITQPVDSTKMEDASPAFSAAIEVESTTAKIADEALPVVSTTANESLALIQTADIEKTSSSPTNTYSTPLTTTTATIDLPAYSTPASYRTTQKSKDVSIFGLDSSLAAGVGGAFGTLLYYFVRGDLTFSNSNSEATEDEKRAFQDILAQERYYDQGEEGMTQDMFRQMQKIQDAQEQYAAAFPLVAQWTQLSDGSIRGEIFGSDKFENGFEVTTSPVMVRAMPGTVVKTINGSRYFLGERKGVFGTTKIEK